MMKLRKIEILEKDNNKKGDLFGRLIADLFHTLGYDEPRLNIHKSGREIDLTSEHRTEQKIAVAECKAHSEPIGGAEINKFIGVLDAEKRKIKKDKKFTGYTVNGYFISLSGFRETAIEQEKEFDKKRVILIKAEKVVEELIHGRVVVSPETAISSLGSVSHQFKLIPHFDLLAHSRGWIWVIYYSDSDGQKTTHFALVHAEGKPLIRELADEIVAIDLKSNSIFSNLILLNSPKQNSSENKELLRTKEKYFKYLENELGEIQFEGLPTDKEAGTVKVKLENIFVPLHLDIIRNDTKKALKRREGIGDILKENSKLAILAKPGGGKSTLLKRIAIAYAFPERRGEINDKLPEKNWLPIFLRCRELGENVNLSITDIINTIPIRAEIPSCAPYFTSLISSALQNGEALLLIDGLDEIAEDKNRIAFVNQLRTFIATYPTINIIVTSREAGFRMVAGSLAIHCENYTISNLSENEIIHLCLKWHRSIIDDSDNTKNDALKLSQLILKDNRIRVLAENPLLLTTLLFVKRWAGYLPTKRSVLYQEMIKLLLVTWNVEGHEILDIEEAEPQLAYVAYWMMKNGQQTIDSDQLLSCLVDARKQMPEVLGYTKISPSEFIKRVELRSSLLIMSGHKRSESGSVIAVYEFLHLSFQEYLTAKAIVKKFIPESDIKNNIVEVLNPFIQNETWKEVIPLVAVLLERNSKELVEILILKTKENAVNRDDNAIQEIDSSPLLLGNCLANEVQISPELLDTAIEWHAKSKFSLFDEEVITEIILNNKFGSTYRKKVRDLLFEKYDDYFFGSLGSTAGDIFLFDLKNSVNESDTLNKICDEIITANNEEQCVAILALMSYSYNFALRSSANNQISISNDIYKIFATLLTGNSIQIKYSINWCISWMAGTFKLPKRSVDILIVQLLNLWTVPNEDNFQRSISWALSKIIYSKFPKEKILKIPGIRTLIWEAYTKPKNLFDKILAVLLGTIIEERFDKKEIALILKEQLHTRQRNISGFLEKLNIKYNT